MSDISGRVQKRFQAVFSHDFHARLRSMGTVAYALLVTSVAISGLWLATTLSSANTFAEVRPVLATALAPLAAFFGATDGASDAFTAITAEGQVTAMDELEVLAPASARVVAIDVVAGQTIAAGDVIARLDSADARRTLRDAQLELANAKLEYERSTSSHSDPAGATRDAITVLANVFANMPWVIDESANILYGNDISADRSNMNAYADKAAAYPETAHYRDAVAENHAAAQEAYRKARISYQSASADTAATEAMLREAQKMLESAVRALVSAQNFFTFVEDHYADPLVPLMFHEHEKGINERAVTASDNLEAVTNALAAMEVARPAELGSVDLRDAQLRIEAAEHAVADAQARLDDYVIRAPIAGEIAEVLAHGTSVLDGQIVARIASPENVARVSIREADVAGVRVGQKARVTFPGVGDFEIVGEVIAVDSHATVANSTVTFFAYIGFPAGETRPRPGMSVRVLIGN